VFHTKPKKLGQKSAPATLHHECHTEPKKLGQKSAPAALHHVCHTKPKKLGQNSAPAVLHHERHTQLRLTTEETATNIPSYSRALGFIFSFHLFLLRLFGDNNHVRCLEVSCSET